MIAILVLIAAAVVFLLLYFRLKKPSYYSLFEVLQQIGRQLGLKEEIYKRYPMPTLEGSFFGFPFLMEGMPKKRKRDGRRGYRLIATIELPRELNMRLFLLHEKRKTSLKPIVDLKLVTTPVPRFNESFLLLANPVPGVAAVFQPYLCEKILSLSELDWQLDVHGSVAHFEVWQEILNANLLSDLMKVMMECLNDLILTDPSAQ